MKQGKKYIEGELFLSLEVVANVYEIELSSLREAYDFGLFGIGVESNAIRFIAAVQLDRVSTVVRFRNVLGLDLETIRDVLEDLNERIDS